MPSGSRTTARMVSVFVTCKLKHLSMAVLSSALDCGTNPGTIGERGREAVGLGSKNWRRCNVLDPVQELRFRGDVGMTINI